MQAVTVVSPIHHHHWVIAEPSGHLSIGVCKHCQALRTFQNWLAETDFISNEESRSLAPLRGPG
ncbi:MAG: hypothetical protein ABI939_07855 [Anaerolineaceae bacterium]